jgi:hypothetical protein
VDSSAGGVVSSSATSAASSFPSQDKSVDFLQSTQTGCQPSTTITSNVLLGKDQYLQARPDHRHGWGAKDTGNVDQSCLGTASAGASSCASVVAASSVATAAGSTLP